MSNLFIPDFSKGEKGTTRVSFSGTSNFNKNLSYVLLDIFVLIGIMTDYSGIFLEICEFFSSFSWLSELSLYNYNSYCFYASTSNLRDISSFFFAILSVIFYFGGRLLSDFIYSGLEIGLGAVIFYP